MNCWQNSESLYKEACQYLAGGVSTGFRRDFSKLLYIEKAEGSHLVDVDGNEYVDYLMGFGPLVLGHSYPALVKSVQEAVARGQNYGAEHKGELELSKRLVKLIPCAEMVCFNTTGTEAIQSALRLARGHAGRQKIVKFQGHYHGWIDSIYTNDSYTDTESTDPLRSEVANKLKVGSDYPATNGQNLNALKDVFILPWNDLEAFKEMIQEHDGGDEIAGVICEPVPCHTGLIPLQPGFMEEVRRITSNKGIVLIFDEIITGFRLGIGGAQEYLGIKPDIAVLGKTVGGGLPISVIAGTKEVMKQVVEGKTAHVGTFNGNPVATAAAIASLDELSNKRDIIYPHMKKIANLLVEGIRKRADKFGIPLLINQANSIFFVMFTTARRVSSFSEFMSRDTERYKQFAAALIEEGVMVMPNGLWYVSLAHDEKDVQKTLTAVENALKCI